MNKELNINLFYKNDGCSILDVLEKEFKEFLNEYIKNILNKL